MKIKFNYQQVDGWENEAKLYFGFFTNQEKNIIENSLKICKTIMYNKRKTNTEKFKREPKNKYYIQFITSDFEEFERSIRLAANTEYELDTFEHAYLV